MDVDSYIPQIVERVKQEQPEKIILFGSYANGNHDAESDVDLFVVNDMDAREFREFRIKLKIKLWDLMRKWNIPVDIIVDSQERISSRIADGDTFYRDIFSKGHVNYA